MATAMSSGWTTDRKGTDMSARTAQISAGRQSALLPAVLALAIGFGMVFVAGLVQAETLHDAAHDTRHATGFPCH